MLERAWADSVPSGVCKVGRNHGQDIISWPVNWRPPQKSSSPLEQHRQRTPLRFYSHKPLPQQRKCTPGRIQASGRKGGPVLSSPEKCREAGRGFREGQSKKKSLKNKNSWRLSLLRGSQKWQVAGSSSALREAPGLCRSTFSTTVTESPFPSKKRGCRQNTSHAPLPGPPRLAASLAPRGKRGGGRHAEPVTARPPQEGPHRTEGGRHRKSSPTAAASAGS